MSIAKLDLGGFQLLPHGLAFRFRLLPGFLRVLCLLLQGRDLGLDRFPRRLGFLGLLLQHALAILRFRLRLFRFLQALLEIDVLRPLRVPFHLELLQLRREIGLLALGGLAQPFLVHVRERQVAALGGERACQGASDSRCRAGDGGDPIA